MHEGFELELRFITLRRCLHYSTTAMASETCVFGKNESQFILELIYLYSNAARRDFESDIYPLWDTVWNTFISLFKNVSERPEIILAVAAQYTLEHRYPNARGSTSHHIKIPDNVILKLDDTPQRKLVFWAELKRLEYPHRWLTADGRAVANKAIGKAVPQVNTQAQYAFAHFNMAQKLNAVIHALIISGPYFVMVEYRADRMSPGFFTENYARRNAAVTRSRNQNYEIEEDPIEDTQTMPFYPFGAIPHCLFDVTDAELEAGNYELTQEVKLNPMLLQALRTVLRNHEDIRSGMQRVDWFDCLTVQT
ncbi:hypothetical protein EV368DRAFT_78025 [Lentinula lateritia]|nr:hypothetical protein EV368DRAFT_78025 [Lentinula lateritia]